MDLTVKALMGATVVVLISALSRTPSYHVAGLVPLFPTFGLIVHYVVGTERTVPELRHTVVFGMVSTIPYFGYMISVYLLAGRIRLAGVLATSTVVWLGLAAVLLMVWKR